MKAVFAAVVVAGLALTACGEPEPAGGALPPSSDVTTPSTGTASSTAPPTTLELRSIGSNGPFDPAAELRPDLMLVEPSTAASGDPVTVTYPAGRERGVAYVLEQWIDGGWHTTHDMTAATEQYGTEPSWVLHGTDGYGWVDIGISGTGPDRLVIPESALAGDYRICTANSLENICAEVTVVEPDESTIDEPEPILEQGFGDPAPVAEFVGEPLDVFEEIVHDDAVQLGPVRVAWRDGQHQDLTDDLVPGRVNVAVETRDGVEIVVDARVEVDPDTGATGSEATVVAVHEGVEFYPACGNEQLEHDGVVWHQVQPFEHPEIYERAANGHREQAPETVDVRGFAARVVEPGPGDDVGTLVVWSDGVAYFVSDSGDLYAWLVTDEVRYGWDC